MMIFISWSEFYHSRGSIQSLIKCLSDPDDDVRKFAAFAIGNAAFHNDSLYDSV
jgi:HEAT repeat protein